jgi:hypothetical protein
MRELFQVMEMFYTQIIVMVAQLYEFTKNHWPSHLWWVFLWYANYTSKTVKMFFKNFFKEESTVY